jgi:hypothetical protein
MTTSFIIDEYDPALGYHPSVTPLDIQMLDRIHQIQYTHSILVVVLYRRWHHM